MYDMIIIGAGPAAISMAVEARTAGVDTGNLLVLERAKEHSFTLVPGLFLVGDLSTGPKGGSIIWAFNSANTAMQKICRDYLGCPGGAPPLA